MPQTIEGNLDAKGLSFAVLFPRFNEEIGRGLLDGALRCLGDHGAEEGDITVYRLPGSFELPTLARQLAKPPPRHDAIVCLGVLLRGETLHFELVAAEVARGIAAVSLETGVPVTFGVIAADDEAQARARTGAAHGGKIGNRGWESALAAIEMARLMQ